MIEFGKCSRCGEGLILSDEDTFKFEGTIIDNVLVKIKWTCVMCGYINVR